MTVQLPFINKMQNANKMVYKNALELLKNIDGNFKDDWIWDVFGSSRSSNSYLYKLFYGLCDDFSVVLTS